MRDWKIFSPIQIGNVTLKNRMVFAPTESQLADTKGYITDLQLDHYRRMAKGGAGLVIVECTAVHPNSAQFMHGTSMWSDDYNDGLHSLAEAIHEGGAKAAIQAFHGGRNAIICNKFESSSAIMPDLSLLMPQFKRTPHELTTKEVEDRIESFAIASDRAKRVGFDMVQLHAAHGMLIGQFLSPFTNKRTDKYGGDLDGRMRFLIEIIERSRDYVGPDYPIMVRINGDDYVQDLGKAGFVISEAKILAKRLEEAGTDALNVSAGFLFDANDWYGQPLYYPRACIIHLAEEIRKVVKIPVSGVGRLNAPIARRIVEEEKVDFVDFCRPLLADPELPKKMAEGRLGDIRMCMACNDACIRTIAAQMPINCAINAEIGQPEEFSEIKPAEKKKKILVVGGGPAGMEAARVLKLRGHEVILYEKDAKLGGLLRVASKSPLTKELKVAIAFLASQIKKLGVKVELGKEVTEDIVEEIKPDSVIIATGSVSKKPAILGIDNPIVSNEMDLWSRDIKTGKKIIVIGGKSYGVETAIGLKGLGKDVFLIEEGDKYTSIAKEFEINRRDAILKRLLPKSGVEVILGAKVKEIQDGGVKIIEKDGSERFIDADNVIISLGRVSNKDLSKKLKGKVEIHEIGDCVKPRLVHNAIKEAASIGRKL